MAILYGDLSLSVVEGFPSYAVSRDGRIFSLDYRHQGIIRELRPAVTRGYCYVNLWRDRKVSQQAVHRLVAVAFIPTEDGKPHVNHRNLNKSDNRAENLEWCSHAENIAHAAARGRMKATQARRQSCQGVGARTGAENGRKSGPKRAKLTAAQVQEVRERLAAGGVTQRSLAREMGVSDQTISNVVRGKRTVYAL